jgi:hypothetical protein
MPCADDKGLRWIDSSSSFSQAAHFLWMPFEALLPVLNAFPPPAGIRIT